MGDWYQSRKLSPKRMSLRPKGERLSPKSGRLRQKQEMSVQNKLHKYMKKKFILENCYFNNLTQFLHIWPWWPWPLIQWTQDGCVDFEEGRSRRSQFIDRKQFWHIWPWWPWPLTQWPPKSKGFPGRMCGQNLRKVGQGILETRNRRTDIPTHMCKAICPLFFEGGGIKSVSLR